MGSCRELQQGLLQGWRCPQQLPQSHPEHFDGFIWVLKYGLVSSVELQNIILNFELEEWGTHFFCYTVIGDILVRSLEHLLSFGK